MLAHSVEVRPELLQDLGGHALALVDQAKEDVLGADVVVSELERLAERELQDLLGPRRERDVSGRGGLPLADDLFDLLTHGLEGDPQGLQGLGGDPFPLVDQPEQDVLGADVVVVEHPRLFLGEDHDPPGPVGEALKHFVFLRASSRDPSGSPPGSSETPSYPEALRAPAGRFRAPERPRARLYVRGPIRPPGLTEKSEGHATHPERAG